MRAVLFLLLFASTLSFGQRNGVLSKADSLINLAQYDDAIKVIENSAGADDRTRALLTNKFAEILILQAKLQAAEDELKNAGATQDPFIAAITKTNLGFLYLNKARYDLSLDQLAQALTTFQESGNQNTLEAARCLADLCLVYLSTGKLNQAEANGLMALQIRQSLKGQDSEEVAASYNDLGLVYSQTNQDKALEYYEKALAVYEKLHGKDHPKIAIASTNIGFVYRNLKLYGDAVNNFETAESIWKKIYPGGHPNQALALVNLGMTYAQMGNLESSYSYFQKANSIYGSFYGAKHPDIAYVYNQVGVLKLSEKKYDDALGNFQEAILANAPSFSARNPAQNPRVDDCYNPKVLLFSLRSKAEAYEAKHYGKTLKFEELERALSGIQSCDTLVDNIRYHSTDENDKLELGASANEVYEDGVRIAHAMSEMTARSRPYRELAFYFAEKSKSAVLQESIADAEAKSFAGIPSGLLETENDLKASIALFSQKLSQKPGADEERALRASLFGVKQKYADFTKELEKKYPEYYNLKFNATSPSIEKLQQLIGSETAIVSYFVAEKNSRLYSFVITSNKFKAFNSTLPGDFDRLVRGFNNSLYYTVHETYRSSGNALSKLLLRGIPSIRNIIVIPSGRLGTMPFEALPTTRMNENFTFGSVPFLIMRSTVRYEFSAGLLLQKSQATGSKASGIFLCAPVSFPEKDNLEDLPGTESEVNNIANLFTSNKLVATRDQANENLVKSGKLSDYNYLHFATHGVVDETAPELSRIFLQSSTSEDGNVFSGEIFNLRLNADLAVLSACQTGLGKFSKGEGVIGLSRALVYAGARSIIVSYWSVADESTSQLMTDFYTQLLQLPGRGASESLRRAKMDMISGGRFAAPYYWAPFVLIGF